MPAQTRPILSSSTLPPLPSSTSTSETSSSPPRPPSFPATEALQKPPRAQLSTSSNSIALPSPFANSVHRTSERSLPSLSTSNDTASFVELLRPDGTAYSPPRPATTSSNRTGKSDKGQPLRGTDRRASVGSLKSLVDREMGVRSRGNGGEQAQRRGSTSSSERRNSNQDLPPIPPNAEERNGRSRGASLSQLSWGTWWPFQVVEPEQADANVSTSGAPTEPRKDSHDSTRGFLSLFAGKQAVDAAHREQATLASQDQAEANLLEADLEALRRLSLSTSASDNEVVSREADDSPYRPIRNDRSLPPTPSRDESQPVSSSPTSFLPSLFSASSNLNTKKSKGSAEFTSSKQTRPSPSASLLSSFTLPNPFSTNPSSSDKASLFSPASPPLSAGSRPNLARHYTTSRHPKTDEGPTAKKGEVEDMVDDADKAAVEEEVEENAEMFSILKERYRAPKLPIVFCHGLFGFDHLGPASIKPLQFSYWVGVAEALEAMGVEVLIGRVPASASIEERAKVLCEMIGERFPGREVNLIGHSMGGLDARFLISRLKPTNFKVRSLTTISTPHRGSSFADFLLEDVVGKSRVPTMLSVLSALGIPGGGAAFDDLTTTKMARFNEETLDDVAVRYFSYGAEFNPSWSNVFKVPWGVVYEREGTNDGLVSVDSAKWGEYQATLHNVNHLDLIGMVGKVRYGWAEWLGKPIKFKPISFFCALAEKLADEGY